MTKIAQNKTEVISILRYRIQRWERKSFKDYEKKTFPSEENFESAD